MDYSIPPIAHPDVESLLTLDSQELFRLLELFDSPLNLVFPEIMQTKIKGFRQALDEAGQDAGQIYFAAKANKANAFLSASAAAKIGVDVSSVQELGSAMRNGVHGESISVSGPTKPPELLALAYIHNARIGIDEPSELNRLARVMKALSFNHPARVYLRLASFTRASRFGMDGESITKALQLLSKSKREFQLEGFSFHVPGYASSDRVQMIGRAGEALVEASGLGFDCSRIDIGGGFRSAYAHIQDWDSERAVDREFFGDVKPQRLYPYSSEVSGQAQLAEILDQSKSALAGVSGKINRSVVIDIEPGRSALEQSGITVFRVRAVREVGNRWVVVVDGNSRDLADSFGNEFLVDPVLITRRKVARQSFPAAIASNTCKEDDFLARRFIPLPFKPATGDLLAYVNTAGYEMDSKESTFHRLPLPTKVVAMKQAGSWRFVADSGFSVADCLDLPESSG